MQREIDILIKARNVVYSCNTQEQLALAYKYCMVAADYIANNFYRRGLFLCRETEIEILKLDTVYMMETMIDCHRETLAMEQS
jgi:hypothetical protein